MAGLALGRASSHQRGMQRLAITALAVAAVPLANALLGRMLGGGRRQQPPAGGGRRHARTPAEREARRLRLWDAVQHAAEAAAAVGMVPPEEQEMLTRVMQASLLLGVCLVAFGGAAAVGMVPPEEQVSC